MKGEEDPLIAQYGMMIWSQIYVLQVKEIFLSNWSSHLISRVHYELS